MVRMWVKGPMSTKVTLAASIVAYCVLATPAWARSIQVDDGGGAWEQNFNNVLDDVGDTGEVALPLPFFGAASLFVSARGAVSFGAPISAVGDFSSAAVPWIAPLFLGADPGSYTIAFDWGGASAGRNAALDGEPGSSDPLNELVPVDSGGTLFADAAFRVTWFAQDANEELVDTLQLVVWYLQNGDYVLMFNVEETQWGLPGSFVGFNLGPGLTFDASTVGYIDLATCPASCGNYVAPGFPADLLAAFAPDEVNGDPLSGRALFYIPGSVSVPEPSSAGLLLVGLVLLFAGRRRRS